MWSAVFLLFRSPTTNYCSSKFTWVNFQNSDASKVVIFCLINAILALPVTSDCRTIIYWPEEVITTHFRFNALSIKYLITQRILVRFSFSLHIWKLQTILNKIDTTCYCRIYIVFPSGDCQRFVGLFSDSRFLVFLAATKRIVHFKLYIIKPKQRKVLTDVPILHRMTLVLGRYDIYWRSYSRFSERRVKSIFTSYCRLRGKFV